MEQVFFKSFEMKASEMWIPRTAHTLFLTTRHKTFWASPSGTQKEAEKKQPRGGPAAQRVLHPPCPSHFQLLCLLQTWGQKSQEGDVSVPEYSSVAARAQNIALRLTEALPDFRSYYMCGCTPSPEGGKGQPFAKGWVFIPMYFHEVLEEWMSPMRAKRQTETRITGNRDPGRRLGLRRKLRCGVQKRGWGRERCRKRRHQRLFGVQAFPLHAFKTWRWSVGTLCKVPEAQLCALWWPRRVGWGWWWEGGPRGMGYMHTYSWLTLWYSRN